LYSSSNIKVVKLWRIRWAGHIALMGCGLFYSALSIESNGKTKNDEELKIILEGNGRDLLEVLFPHLAGGTEETTSPPPVRIVGVPA
jgi:hypothetical protein